VDPHPQVDDPGFVEIKLPLHPQPSRLHFLFKLGFLVMAKVTDFFVEPAVQPGIEWNNEHDSAHSG